MKAKKFFSLLLGAALALTLLPTTAQAAQAGDFTVDVDAGYTYDAANHVLTFTQNGTYTVSMASGVIQTTTDRIVVSSGVTTDITLVGVKIDVSAASAGAFDMTGATVKLTLSGANILKSSGVCAGLQAPSGATLTIGGAGSLLAAKIYTWGTSQYAAGIGGGSGQTGGDITVIGGTVTAISDDFGAGIGGGSGGGGGTVTVTGGTVTATNNSSGAGIGGGFGGGGGTVIISGGTVTATSNFGGAGIGGGMDGAGGTVAITGGTVNATGGEYGGAGIGGGASDFFGSSGGTVTITGGTVTATGGEYGGAGIGGGTYGSGGTVTISGGSVKAAGSGGGTDIGGGAYSSGNGTLKNGSGAPVWRTTLTFAGMTDTAIPATALGFGGAAAGYGKKDLTTDVAGALSFYLPEGGASAAHGGALYTETVESNHSNTFVSAAGSAYVVRYGLTDLTPAALTSLAVAGSSFSAALIPATGFILPDAVAVTMDGVALTAGAGYTYDSAAGTVSIGSVTGDIVIMAAGVPVTYTVTAAPASLDFGSATAGHAAPAAQTVTITNSGNSAVTGYAVTGGGADFNVVYTSAPIASGGTGTFTVQPKTGLAVGAHTATLSIAASEGSTATVNVRFTVNAASSSSGSAAYYTITASAGAGGSISPSGSAAVPSGSDKTYTITASDGYKIANVLADGVSVGAVSTYTFQNVKKAHTIAASFNQTVTNPFADVKTGDWFYDDVLFVYGQGLMHGTASGMFGPSGTMTRAMIVTVLYRMSGDAGSYANPFGDIVSGAYYEKAVAWAYANDIAGGVGSNRFAPEDAVSREQLAVMLYRYAKYKGYDVSVGEDTNILSYNDALSIADYAYPALQWACGAGILNGDGSGGLNPQGFATRAEVAAMLQRFMASTVD